jgi:hypothetical protein
MKAIVGLVAVAGVAASALAAPTLTPKASFGNAGWRAPHVVLAGDTPGSEGVSTAAASPFFGQNVYKYLSGVASENTFGGANLERGLAYNPATGNLILVSRSNAGGGLRVLDGATGVDKGQLNQGTGIITGGNVTANKVGVSGDGQVFIANLQANTNTGAYKIYNWSSETAAAPTTWYNATVPATGGTPRLGDSLDVTGSGASTRVVTGFAGVRGYATLVGGAVSTTVQAFAPSDPGVGRFRLGVTFAQDENNVWGKETSQPLWRTSYAGNAGTTLGSGLLTSAGEAQMDYAEIGGVAYLAAIDVNNSRVYVYDMTNPAAPVSLFPFGITATTYNTTTNPAPANGNAAGEVKWGAIDNPSKTATLYAMSTNQGIQAFTFVVPAPGAAGVLGLAGLAMLRRRR